MMKHLEVWLVALDPTQGSEINKTRPCVVLSSDDSEWLNTRVIAPMTRTIKNWPWRVKTEFKGKIGEVALDQIRCIDMRERAIHRIGRIDPITANKMKKRLGVMLAIRAG